MKNIIILLMLVVSTVVGAQNNKFEKLYQDFEDEKGVTTISINKAMFSMLGNMKLDAELENLDGILKKLNSVKMIIIDDEDSGSKTRDELKKSIKKLGLEELISINNDGNKIKFYTEDSKGDTFKNVILNINNPDSFLFMILDGTITASDLNSIVQSSK
jgi:hypothetical protein